MNQMRELAVKVQQIILTLQHLRLPATPENLQGMLVCLTELEAVRNELVRMTGNLEEVKANGGERSEENHRTEGQPE